MGGWLVTGVAAVFALAAVVAALMSGGRARRAAPPTPPWTLPAPDDLEETRFPLAWRGYDADHVDAHLDRLNAAYGALFEAADPAAVERARAALAPEGPEVTPAD